MAQFEINPSVSLNSLWPVINEALKTEPVTVNGAGVISGNIDIKRIDSAHRLTINGHGTATVRGNYPVFFGSGKKYNRTTITGWNIRSTKGISVYIWGGDFNEILNNHIRQEVGGHGPCIHLLYAHVVSGSAAGTCVGNKFNNNDLEGFFGEGIYIGGCENTNNKAHQDTEVVGNRIIDAGVLGGQGDGIDVKDGNFAVKIYDNEIAQSSGNRSKGRIAIDVMCAADIQRNYVENFSSNGISFGAFWNKFVHGARKGGKAINNTVINCGGGGPYSWVNGIHVDGQATGDNFEDTVIKDNKIRVSPTGKDIYVSPHSKNTTVGTNDIKPYNPNEIPVDPKPLPPEPEPEPTPEPEPEPTPEPEPEPTPEFVPAGITKDEVRQIVKEELNILFAQIKNITYEMKAK